MKKHTTLNFIIGISIVIIATIWVLLHDNKTLPQQTKQPIKLGVAAALTGFASEWGQDELRAAELAVEETNQRGGVNDASIELVVEDIQSDNTATVQAFSKLINIDQVPAIIGPTWGETFAGGLPLAEENQIVVMSPSAALEIAEEEHDLSYVFSTFWPLDEEVLTLLRFLLKNDLNNVIVINDLGAFNTKITELFIRHSKTFGVNIIDHVELDVGQSDFRTVITKTKKQNPDVVFIEIEDISQLGPFAKQAQELKLDALFVSTTSAQNEQMLNNYKPYVDGFVYSYPLIKHGEQYSNLINKYIAKYNHPPTGPSFVNAYNATHAIIATLQAGAKTGPEIKNKLNKLKIKGIGMPDIAFDNKGQVEEVNFEIKTIKNGQFVELK